MKCMSILVFRRGGIVIAAVLVLMYSAAGEMRVGGETKWETLPPLSLMYFTDWVVIFKTMKYLNQRSNCQTLEFGYSFT